MISTLDCFYYVVVFLIVINIAYAIWKDYMHRECPFCKAKIPKAASVCSHCSRDVPVIETGWLGRP
ncbi:MAG: hypothetical protein WC647_03970 [Desulfomonilaceae bacterium]